MYDLSEKGTKIINTQVTQNASGEPVYANVALQVHDNPRTILPAIYTMTITPFSLLTCFSGNISNSSAHHPCEVYRRVGY